jgi:hypothetical protein
VADTKISALTAAGSAAAANEYAINEAGTSKKVTGTQVKTFVNTAPVFAAGTASAGTWPVMTSGTLLTAAEAGAMEFDGNLHYRTTDTTAGRQLAHDQMVFYTTADGSAIGAAIADAFGSNSAFTTISGAVYEINYHCWYLKSTAGTSTWTVTNTQTYTAFTGTRIICAVGGIGAAGAVSAAGLANQTTAAAAFPVSGSLTDATQQYAHINVICTIGTAGNIRLRHTSGAGTITMRRGSYYTVRRLFPGNVGSFVA